MDLKSLKTVFFGTPEVAVPYLRLLAERTSLLAAVSQPDKPAGRGLELKPTPVRGAAEALGVPVRQPARPSELAAELKALAPDLFVVVAYGRLLKPDLLAVPRLGALNAHFSLLPKYRGAAPVQWSLARGETRTGVTLFWLDEGMDTGPVQDARETSVDPGEDAPALLARLTALGVELLAENLPRLAAGEVRRAAQLGEPSLAPLIRREDARLDPGAQEAEAALGLVRGFRSWPKAWLELAPPRGRLAVLRAAPAAAGDPPGRGVPGRVLRVDRNRGLLVEFRSCSRLWFLEVQSEGNKPLSAADFANGLRLAEGSFLPLPGAKNEPEERGSGKP